MKSINYCQCKIHFIKILIKNYHCHLIFILLKGHDAEHMLLKTEYEQLQKQYKDSITEIKRLRGLVIKYQNANKRNSSTSLN